MLRQRARLIAVVLCSHLALFCGALLSQSQFTIAVILVFDALLGMARLLFERLVAGRSRGDTLPAMGPYRLLEPLYEVVLDKRGRVRLTERLPPLYPRNLPFVLDQWVVFFWLIPISVVTWATLEPLEGGLSLSAIPVLCLFAAKHHLIVTVWAASGRYDEASAITIRRSRDLFYTGLVACFAVWTLATAPPTAVRVTAATMVLLLVKVPFDFRETGLLPWPLGLDTESDTEGVHPISAPLSTPRSVFDVDRRLVRTWALREGVAYTLVGMLYLGSFVGTVGAFVFVSVTAVFVGVATGVVVSLVLAVPTALLVFQVGRANESYHCHDDVLVAYDTSLDATQWVVPLADIRSVTVDDDVRDWTFWRVFDPLAVRTLSVEITQTTGETRRIRWLATPDEFAQTLRHLVDERVETDQHDSGSEGRVGVSEG